MDAIPGQTTDSKSEKQISLHISTPTLHSLRSITTTQEPPDIAHTPAGDIPPPPFINSITELRSFSTALSEFLCRYDDLHNHIKFINASIDSKLPNQIVDATNPSQPALTQLLEIENVSPEITESAQNPKHGTSGCERSRESEKTTDGIRLSQNFEEVDKLTKFEAFDVTKNHEEIDICTSPIKIDASKKPRYADVLKNNEEVDALKKSIEIDASKNCEEFVVSKKLAESDNSEKPEFVDVSRISEEIDACKKSVEIDALKKCEEIDVLKKIGEIVVSTKHAETDISKKPEETFPETACDQTVTVVSDAFIPKQNPNEIITICKQIYENVQMPENVEEIVVLEKSEQTDIMNKPEEIETDIQKKNEQTDICKNPEEINSNTSVNHEEIDVLHKPEEFDSSMDWEEIKDVTNTEDDHTSKNTEEIDTMKKPEQQTDICKKPEETEIVTLKKHMETNVPRKHEETKTSKNIISELETICQSLNYKELKWHIASHYSQMKQHQKEIAKALKRVKNPGNLVLNSIGRFFMQGRRSFHKNSGSPHDNLTEVRLASVLILECFVMISEDIKIVKEDQENAVNAAFDWRKRMMNEGGLRNAVEVDARGLLFLIIGFRIIFKARDIANLIIASHFEGISSALRSSVFLTRQIPEVVNWMAKANFEIEAVELAFTFGVEDKCDPKKILSKYLHRIIKNIQIISSFQMLKKLSDLKSLKRRLESHSIDPSIFLPDLDKEIENLDQEINERNLIRKRKSLESPIHHESKRARSRSRHENTRYHQEPVDHHNTYAYNRSPQTRTRHFDFDRNRSNNYSSDYGPSPDRLAGGYPGSYVHVVHPANGQPYGYHEPYGQTYTRYDQTYDSQPYGGPRGWGPPESAPEFRDIHPSSGFSGRRGPSSDLYGFADIVEKESCGYRPSGGYGA